MVILHSRTGHQSEVDSRNRSRRQQHQRPCGGSTPLRMEWYMEWYTIYNIQFMVQKLLILIKYWRLSSIEQERIQWQELALKKPGPKVERTTNCKIQNCGIIYLPKKKEQYMTNIQAYNSHTICLNTKGKNTKENVYRTGWKEKTINKIIHVYF